MPADVPDYTEEVPVVRVGSPVRMDLPSAGFQPREPKSWEEMGVDPAVVELIVLRYLAGEGAAASRTIAMELGVASTLVQELLAGMKAVKLVQHRGTTAMGDFIHELTESGRNKAIESRKLTTYVGPVPVPFPTYVKSVQQQTVANERPTRQQLERAFDDLILTEAMLSRIGPALAGGRAMFLYGDPGNGKTSIAERITRSFGQSIWIPITLMIDGHLVKLFDPSVHEPVSAPKTLSVAERSDRRWVRIRRPTVIAGGELTLDMLEIQHNAFTGVSEAPLQLKANGGTLVIDDFGRQRMEPQVLLNRWIFPLERRIDYLRVPDGRKIPAPFDPMLVFSTNLEPSALVDEAFLRRIPYKLKVPDPSREQFIQLLEIKAADMGVSLPAGSVRYLMERHFSKRIMRFCHPRDLLQQVVDTCRFERRALQALPEDWDKAVSHYFAT